LVDIVEPKVADVVEESEYRQRCCESTPANLVSPLCSLLTLVLCLKTSISLFLSLALPPHTLLLSYILSWLKGITQRSRVLSSGRGKPLNDPSNTSLSLRDPFSCANHHQPAAKLIFWGPDGIRTPSNVVTESRAYTYTSESLSLTQCFILSST
jgi:hypothetical protein